MEIIGVAALIAVGIVVAAIIYGRMHGARTVAVASPAPSAPVVEARPANSRRPDAELLERTAAVTRREDALLRKEAELETERAALGESRQELERSLEQISGLSAGRAKQLLLKEVEDQAKHDAARRIRQIEEETKREAERRAGSAVGDLHAHLAVASGGRRAEALPYAVGERFLIRGLEHHHIAPDARARNRVGRHA